ncbi:DUF389 domain-containing protein [Demequina sp. SO4-13]|uniref:DUF389 domain-containing protein n=1 Tax=Demequina sp. SO4-13 TaxID=3401027 RepID=UPI003AF429A4
MSFLSDFRASSDSVARMRRDVLFEHDDNARRYSKFWALMLLSGALAAAAVLTESLAALIGAMIVSPFITPITAVMLAAVLSQRTNLLRSVGQVLAGAAAVIAIGFLLGLLWEAPVTAETNSLVAARVVPIAFDIVVGALTGVIAAVALVREDISNSVPGVAIAVTLISALAVTGTLLESGQYSQAWAAFMLFGANASATVAAGTVTMAVCGVRASLGFPLDKGSIDAEDDDPRRVDRGPWSRVITLGVMALVIAAPLIASAIHLTATQGTQDTAHEVAREWALGHDLEFVGIDATGEHLTMSFEGPAPFPATEDLATALEARGLDPAQVEVRLMPVTTHMLRDGSAAPDR